MKVRGFGLGVRGLRSSELYLDPKSIGPRYSFVASGSGPPSSAAQKPKVTVTGIWLSGGAVEWGGPFYILGFRTPSYRPNYSPVSATWAPKACNRMAFWAVLKAFWAFSLDSAGVQVGIPSTRAQPGFFVLIDCKRT